MPDVRGYVASDGGKKVVPIVSIVLIVAGVGLVLASILGGGETEQPVAQGPTAPAMLEDAMAVAKGYLLSGKPHSYDGFDAKGAEAQDASFTWTTDGPAAVGQISIRTSGRTKVVLVTKDGPTGVTYCIGDTNGDEDLTRGRTDASGPAECTGGWDA